MLTLSSLAIGVARFVPTFPTEVVDTLGAWDAFDVRFIAARLEGLDTEIAL